MSNVKKLYTNYQIKSGYSSDLSITQALLTMVSLDGCLSSLRKYRPIEVIEAIAYVLKTGCRWPMIPAHFPNWKTVYHHFRTLSDAIADLDGVFLDCVKSNFGTPDFIPIEGRWVVERTFSRMENYRRLTRNYERLLKVAAHIFIAACALSSDVGWHIMCLCHYYMPVLTKSPYARRLSGDFRQASSVM